MLGAKPPADFLKFMESRHEDIYELLSVNENRIGWTLYTECDLHHLLKAIESELVDEVINCSLNLHHIAGCLLGVGWAALVA